MVEKKFFRVRLSDTCPVTKKMVNGVTLTKQWQIKTGEVGDFAKFPDVETEAMIKQGNTFIPANPTDEDTNASNPEGSKHPDPTSNKNTKGDQNPTGQDSSPPSFSSMTVEQLKSFLISKSVPQSELRNATKQELIERAEFVWSQK